MATSSAHDTGQSQAVGQPTQELDGPLSHRDLMMLADSIDGTFMIGLGIYLGFIPRELDAINSSFSSKRIGVLELLFQWRDRQSSTGNTRLALAEKLHAAGLHAQADTLTTCNATQRDTPLPQERRNIIPMQDHIDDIIKSITRSKLSGLMKTLLEQFHGMPTVDKLRIKGRILLYLDDALARYEDEQQHLAEIETSARYKLTDIHESLMKLTLNYQNQSTADVGFTNYIQSILARVTNASHQEELSWEIVAMTGDDEDEPPTPGRLQTDIHQHEIFDLPSERYAKKEIRSTDMLAQYIHMQWEFIGYHQLLAVEYDVSPSNEHKDKMVKHAAIAGLGENVVNHISHSLSQGDGKSWPILHKGEMSDKSFFIIWRQRCKSYRRSMAAMYALLYNLSKNSEFHDELHSSNPASHVEEAGLDPTEIEFLSTGVDYITRQKREIRVLKRSITNFKEKLNLKDEEIECLKKERRDLRSYIRDLEKNPDAVRRKLDQKKDEEIERLKEEKKDLLRKVQQKQDEFLITRSGAMDRLKLDISKLVPQKKRRANDPGGTIRSTKST